MANEPYEKRSRRFVASHRRLFLSFGGGLVLYGVLTVLGSPPHLVMRLLLSWDFATLSYVTASLILIARADVDTCRQRAALYDEGDRVILLAVVASAAASFAAIFALLSATKAPDGLPGAAIALAAITVALSWTFTHIVFTLHYANQYYGVKPPGGLDFPGEDKPDYRDFLYFSFVVGCTAQTSDVAISQPAIRRIALVHGIVSFAFNTAILALTINIGATLIVH